MHHLYFTNFLNTKIKIFQIFNLYLVKKHKMTLIVRTASSALTLASPQSDNLLQQMQSPT